MYCAGCGTEIQSGLNYCSRCGRRIAEEVSYGKQILANPLVIVGQTAGVGFVAYIFIILVLTKSGAMPNLFLPITFFYFAALFGICFLILQHGRSVSDSGKTAAPPTDKVNTPAYLRPVTTAQLEEGREFDIGSVTDATTRTLDEVRVREKR